MNLDGFIRAVFLLLTMSTAGILHVLWLKSRFAERFSQPVDFGMVFRGHRLFGDNKRLCGFMVLPPAAAIVFPIFFVLIDTSFPTFAAGLWSLSKQQYAGLGFACGLAFMLAELPNSLIKRQLDIEPGKAPERGWLRTAVILADRFDSVVGVLLITSLLVPVHVSTWLFLLFGGPLVHAFFSYVMHALGIKERAL